MNKYYNLIAVVFVILICSCKGENTKKGEVIESINDEDSITVFDFSANILNECPIDTLSYDNLIKSVRYIPLETTDKSVLGGNAIQIRKIEDNLIVSSGVFKGMLIKRFDINGKYIGNLFNLGRGRNELTFPFNWTANDSAKVIIIVGQNKLLYYYASTSSLSDIRVKDTPYLSTMLNNGDYVVSQSETSDPRSGTSELPYMYFLDRNGNVISERYYSSKRDIAYRAIPDVGSYPYESYILKPAYYGSVFSDMFNDTIYKIKSKDNIVPGYVLNRGKKYMPLIDEVHDDLNMKAKKIYFVSVTDSPDYLFVSYWYNELYCNSIWSKKTGDLIADVEIEKDVYNKLFWEYDCYMPFSFDGFKGVLPIDYVTADNKIYVSIKAAQLKNVLSNLKDDDNPVIVEITLK
jgi:hypothetical protein